jgi:hypothetical protein
MRVFLLSACLNEGCSPLSQGSHPSESKDRTLLTIPLWRIEKSKADHCPLDGSATSGSVYVTSGKNRIDDDRGETKQADDDAEQDDGG